MKKLLAGQIALLLCAMTSHAQYIDFTVGSELHWAELENLNINTNEDISGNLDYTRDGFISAIDIGNASIQQFYAYNGNSFGGSFQPYLQANTINMLFVENTDGFHFVTVYDTPMPQPSAHGTVIIQNNILSTSTQGFGVKDDLFEPHIGPEPSTSYEGNDLYFYHTLHTYTDHTTDGFSMGLGNEFLLVTDPTVLSTQSLEWNLIGAMDVGPIAGNTEYISLSLGNSLAVESVNAVPEPATVALISLGFMASFIAYRKRKKQV